MLYLKIRLFISDSICRRPQQARQPGATGGAGGGQGNTGAGGHRGGNKEPLQPTNIPVSKSMFSIDFEKFFHINFYGIFLFFCSINIQH
jgi:hypothetical protein